MTTAGAVRVLVVDDTPSIRFLIRTNLELAGHEIAEAVDGQDALDQLAAADRLPDVMTIDIVMPRLDGIETVTQIRKHREYDGIGIVMVSTQGQQVDLDRASAAGVDEYIVKPFDPEVLVATVERVADSLGP